MIRWKYVITCQILIMFLSLLDIFYFCKYTISSRNVIKEECVVNAKHVILKGREMLVISL